MKQPNKLTEENAMTDFMKTFSFGVMAATAEELNKDADKALESLVKTNLLAEDLSKKAKATLIFPNISKVGLIFGGSHGEGLMKSEGKIDGYYSSFSTSFGLQAGVQSYGYIVFLMSDEAIKSLKDNEGWEIGVDSMVVMVDEGAAKNWSTSTLKDDAYAFIFDQRGLMAGVSIKSTKITLIKQAVLNEKPVASMKTEK